ncbi:MAG: enoyl-CoA hydratase-related protein [Pseudomonadota bacterium]
MEFKTIGYAIGGGIARVTLNRPERLNALTLEMIGELQHALGLAASAQPVVRALQITGAGRGFSSGHDLASPRKAYPDDPREPLRDYYMPLIQMLRTLPFPTVAVVNGACAGAGMGIALACDLVIAARSAYFLPAFVNMGLVPDSGVSGLLASRIGEARATALLMLGERFSAEDAAAWGLVWQCVADEQLADAAGALLDKFANGPTQTYAAIKRLMRTATSNPLQVQMQAEADAQATIRLSADSQEAKRAFLERRKPEFTGL